MRPEIRMPDKRVPDTLHVRISIPCFRGIGKEQIRANGKWKRAERGNRRGSRGECPAGARDSASVLPPGRLKQTSYRAGMPVPSGRRKDTGAFIRAFGQADTKEVRAIWNRAVDDGAAFQQVEDLTKEAKITPEPETFCFRGDLLS